MLFLFLALGCAVLSFIAKSNKLISKVFAVIAFVSFIVWLASGPGFAFLNWLDHPSVPTPNIDVPGV